MNARGEIDQLLAHLRDFESHVEIDRLESWVDRIREILSTHDLVPKGMAPMTVRERLDCEEAAGVDRRWHPLSLEMRLWKCYQALEADNESLRAELATFRLKTSKDMSAYYAEPADYKSTNEEIAALKAELAALTKIGSNRVERCKMAGITFDDVLKILSRERWNHRRTGRELAARIANLEAQCSDYRVLISALEKHGPTHRPSLDWLEKWREIVVDADDFSGSVLRVGWKEEQRRRLLRRIARRIKEARRMT